MKQRTNLLCLLFMFMALPACAAEYPPTYSAEAIEAWVIDAETKKPIEGVIVTANWELVGGFEGNTPVGQMKVLETVTDKDGKFTFSAWGSEPRKKGYLRNRDPQFLLFKPSYEYRRLVNEVSSKISMASLRRSEWNGKTIGMKLFKGTQEEYAEHIYRLGSDMDSMLDFARGDKDCNWKKTPRMLTALHKMSLHFEAQGTKLKGWRLGQRIIRTDDIPHNAKCGSVEEFFRSYLQ
ncbi:hypothetical protein SCL_1022 [Sulfuricaulis limicola]|uniref:Carboxypeptidase regulatory-like domain-containing protein n=1 Tax=Sulfuricaulis limicola TaxID=1620215 RepID=A0A1B4XEV3_9GAMM|nr:hypothetical protein [Sulfuricaulis limicola]BAV33337.1 hypothetical protein SCL_1022 [Sulfuricaulis limicola]